MPKSTKPSKVKCPACKEEIEFNHNEYEEGDFFQCPECRELLNVGIKKGKPTLMTDTEKKNEEMQELDEEMDYEDEE
jgi:uncharacterized protein YbaR (Trm112 family)